MRSTKLQKYFVEGLVMISSDVSNKRDESARYRRLTFCVDGLYLSLQIETPPDGVIKNGAEQKVTGFYVSEYELLSEGNTYPLFDALTKIGMLSVENCV